MKMFQSARLKLTAWYLLIIVFVSTLFSAVIYLNISRQIEGFARMQNNRAREFQFNNPSFFPSPETSELLQVISASDLAAQREDLLYSLMLINLGIVVIAGGAGYFLAGKTLNPIKLMMDEQDQFISDASHELRTPIATLRAEMEGKLLEKKISDREARRLIASNLEDLDRLQKLSNNLLKLARVHAVDGHDNQNHFSAISLPVVISGAWKKVSSLAKKKRICLINEVVAATIRGDEDSLSELFIILFDNAIKYSHPKSKITVSSRNYDSRVEVSVSDRGVGIAKEDLPHIFERFFRADKSRSLVDGYGLGLSIAKKIVDYHRGTISAISQAGSGSTFKVIFPLVGD